MRMAKLERKLQTAKKKKKHFKIERMTKDLEEIKENLIKNQKNKQTSEKREREIKNEFLRKTQVFFSTHSAAGSQSLKDLAFNIDYVIIDEATQSLEPSCLIPMQYGAKQVVLVGDPMQLPPTTFGQRAIQMGIQTSLFERFLISGMSCHMLEV